MKNKISLAIIALFLLSGCGNETPAANGSKDNPVSAEAAAVGQTERTYSLNPVISSLSWSASRLAAKPHTGNVQLKQGSLTDKNGVYTQGEFVIDMTTISETANNEKFLNHVRSDDFFAVEKYPTAAFKLKNAENIRENQLLITGDLTIRGKTNEIRFPATILKEPNGPLNATAAFAIDRTKWGIVFDSGSAFENLGDRAIKDEIQFELKLSFEED